MHVCIRCRWAAGGSYLHHLGVSMLSRAGNVPPSRHSNTQTTPNIPTPPQGYNYSVAFPAGHVPAGNLNVSIYSSTNCGSTAKPLYSFATNRKPTPTSDGGAVLTMAVPTTIKGDGLFLQLASGSARNYSDTFSILPK